MAPSRPIALRSSSRTWRLAVGLVAALALGAPLVPHAEAATPVGFADVAEQVLPAYVDILVRPKSAGGAQAQGQQPQGPFDQFFRDFFDQVPQPGQERNIGSQGDRKSTRLNSSH